MTNATRSQREVNCEQILRAILREGPLARIDLAQFTGLTTAAISNITRELIAYGLLREVGTARGNRVGASAILLDLPEEVPIIGVVHQGVSALRIGLCNLRGHVLARCDIQTPQRYAPEQAVTMITHTLRKLLQDRGYTDDALAGVGAGVVGLVDGERGIVKRAPSLGWESVPLRDLIEERIRRPVVLENNVRAMAFGEALLGQGRAWPDFAFVYVGTGIGSGLIIGGRPYHGAHGGAGEIGHITVDAAGEPCACGNRGCLETIAAEPAIVRNARMHGLELDYAGGTVKEAVRSLVALARRGDEGACEVIRSCGVSLGIALANLIDIFNPERIVLHGVITGAGELFFSAVAECLRQHAFLTRDEYVALVPPSFGDDAGLVGAAAVALDAIVLQGGMREIAKGGVA